MTMTPMEYTSPSAVRSSLNPCEFVDAHDDCRGNVWLYVPDTAGDSAAYAMHFTHEDILELSEILWDIAWNPSSPLELVDIEPSYKGRHRASR